MSLTSNIGSFHDRFHVEDLSSAHVYLRLKKDQRLEDVSDKTVMECAQLVKANSIEGCKLKEVHVVYTRWFVVLHMFRAFVQIINIKKEPQLLLSRS